MSATFPAPCTLQRSLIPLAALLFALLAPGVCPGQLDSVHYIPPAYFPGTSPDDIRDHYLYVSTPEGNPISIEILDGSGEVVLTDDVSNISPIELHLGINSNGGGGYGPPNS